jgi:hypothetical protein
MLDKESLIESYLKFYDDKGRFPEDATEFAAYLGLEEVDFLKSFNPLSSLEAFIWADYFETALTRSQEDQNFEQYSSREIYLSILYNFVGILNENATRNRAMISFSKSLPSSPKQLSRVKTLADAFFKEMIAAGESSGEIASRELVNYQYSKWCWFGLLFVTFFWKKDESEQSEQTDVAIEKVAHLIFDLLNPNALDSSLQFFSFLFKQGFK